jgi:hypothetical protein
VRLGAGAKAAAWWRAQSVYSKCGVVIVAIAKVVEEVVEEVCIVKSGESCSRL